VGGSASAAPPPLVPGQLHSPRFSSHTWVRELLTATDILLIQ